MTTPTRWNSVALPGTNEAAGRSRAALACLGHTITDAFSKLEYQPLVERITRNLNRGLVGAGVVLAADEGSGYWDFTRVRDEFYVVIQNYSYKDPRIELVGGDGLISFNFRLSGDLTLGLSRQKPLQLTGPSLFVCQQPQGVDLTAWTAANALEHCVSIFVRPEFLIKCFFSSSMEAPKAVQKFLVKSTNQVNFLYLPLTPEMFELTTKVVNNQRHGPAALVFAEALCIATALRGHHTIR